MKKTDLAHVLHVVCLAILFCSTHAYAILKKEVVQDTW